MVLKIGLPQWQHPAWRRMGLETLADYARHFDCVEGNTTLYALPDHQTVMRWKTMTNDGFRFCFKFPATISHQSGLINCQDLCADFFRRLDPLQARVAQYWLQLPASFGPEQLTRLWRFFEQLPNGLNYGIEVRHPLFFAKGEAEQALNHGLYQRGINRVILDARAVHYSSSLSKAANEARQHKPKLPVHAITTATQPLIRFIGADEQEISEKFFQNWQKKLIDWRVDKQPFLFIHTPNMGEVFSLLHRLWPGLQNLTQNIADLPLLPEQPSLF